MGRLARGADAAFPGTLHAARPGRCGTVGCVVGPVMNRMSPRVVALCVARALVVTGWFMWIVTTAMNIRAGTGPTGLFDDWRDWAIWALVAGVLTGIGRRVRRRYDLAVADTLFDRAGFEPIPDDAIGPVGVVLVDPDGAETPITVVPFCQSRAGHMVWLGYGPAGAQVPAWGEIRIRLLPPRCDLLMQTEEDEDGGLRFAARPEEPGDPL